MRISSTILILGAAIVPNVVAAQSPPQQASIERSDSWSTTITIFRSPGTGLQVSKGHFAAFLAHYPTVIKRDGQERTTQFVRVGAAYYVNPNTLMTPYASLSLAPSLSKGWSNSALVDVGVRRMFTSRLGGQLGIAVLHAPRSSETRVNPSIGLGVRF